MTPRALSELSPAKRALREARLRGRYQEAPIAPRAQGGDAPLSHAQERLWFVDRMFPGSTLYNLVAPLRLPGALKPAVLERAVAEIVRRHDVLRTTFREVDGAPVQAAAPFTGFTLPVEDLSIHPPEEREAQVQARVAAERAHVFDLSAGPLFRASLLRVDAGSLVLLVNMPHIITDGWSMGVFLRELPPLYEAFNEGWDSPLPPLPVQYADYAAWQREQLTGEVLNRQVAYWRRKLAGAPELLELPTDRPRPPVPSFRGAQVQVAAPAEVLDPLRALATAQGATLHMVVLGAFSVLMGRYAGTQDVSVGLAVSGRSRREIEGLIGIFVNTLVARIDLSGDPTFREVVNRARDTALDAYQHQDVPFERVVAELRPQRNLSYSALFQVQFQLAEVAGEGGGAPDPAPGDSPDSTQVDLTLQLNAFADGLSGTLEYATDLFDQETARRMVRHLVRVMEQVAENPDVRLSRLELLGDAERARVLEEWNQTAAGYPVDACVPALFEAQAARAPGAVAVRFGEESLTYGELNARANRLAHHLAGLGVRAETRVAICLERGPEMVVSVLGVLKAGGAYVPLDPAYPPDRLAFMLADAAVPVLVTQASLRAALPAGDGVAVVSVDGDGDSIAAQSAENPERGVSPDHLAYVIYTSGSTGTPKGVLVQHGSLANLLAATRAAFGVGEGDLMPAMASYAFDIWLFEALLPLTSGAAVRLVERERVMDVPALLSEISDATLVHAVPALMRQMAHAERETPRLAHLRRAFVGGDRVAADLLAEMRGTFSGAETHVLYGPTEGTILASTHPVPEDGIVAGHPIGRPLGNVRLYVCDAPGSPQPAGVPGELLIGGAGVARGYLGRFAMTAERFVPDPFSVEGGERLYRTGDRARWRVDGTLEFLGRVDAQVKVRGFRIEPGEIEAALRSHESVADCVVVAREDVPGDLRLVAYVAGTAEADALREHLRRSLPEHMVPSAFVVLEALPLTPNGKVDRKALPAPEYAAAADQYVAPRTPAEECMAGIWAEVLRVERVGVGDHFFELGGHSLLATQLVSRVREAFGAELPLRAVFEAPTLAELASRVEALQAETLGEAGAPPLVAVPRDGSPLPLSFAQQRLWFIEQLEPGTTAYHMPSVQRLRGPLDVAAMERALGEIVRRHEALRTTFGESEGVPFQVVHPAGATRLEVTDLSGLPTAEREAEANRLAREEAQRLFDLRAGPLFRTRLVRLAEDDHLLVMAMHHVVSDGWSMGVLFGELSALYQAFARGEPSPLPELPLQYADFAVWQRTWLSGEVLEGQIAWWRERLEGAPPVLELPTDHPRTATPGPRTARVFGMLPPETADRARALARREGATLYMVLLAALDVVLGRWSGQEDVVVGSPIAGRTRREVEGLIGFFVNTLALRADLSGNPSFATLLGRVREGTLGAFQHESVPFERLVEELEVERSLSHSPLFQVIFSLAADGGAIGGGGSGGTSSTGDTGGADGQRPVGGLAVEPYGAGAAAAKFDLDVVVMEQQGGLAVGFTYREELWDASTIERLAGAYGLLLDAAAADASRPILDLPLMTGAERQRLLRDWNDTVAELPPACVHELFAEQASRTPEAVALLFQDESVTYAELDRRSNALARRLAALGVGPDARVGICVERGVEMVVGLLGILKAGGAYVPLDPQYPAERLAYMLTDAGVALLLTQERMRDRLPSFEGELVLLDGETAEDAPSAETRRASPENLAYVIYTSGSTGLPKGTEVPHRAIPGFFRGADYARFSEGAVVLQHSSVSWDALTLELWPALLSGGTCVLYPGQTSEPAVLGEQVRTHGVNTLWLTAAYFNLIVDTAPEALEGVRQVMAGGEAVSAAHVRRALELYPNLRLVNGYGPSETTVFATCYPIPADFDAPSVPLGRPVGDRRVYLLDSRFGVVPEGVAGELCIGGPSVARGYLGRPGLTAEKFIPDPFGEPGARLYRSGDRARWRAEIGLEFVGRTDFQVKIRGFRVEPGEVEAIVRALPGVREAAVVVREDVPADKRLVAYVVGEVAADEVREQLRGHLPEHMLPAAFVLLEALPLTANGKLDRRALPAPELASPEEAYVAPRTPTEEVLSGIWAEVLRIERVGAEGSFFELGGHSLLATRVTARVREVFGVELPLRVLFERPVLSELAAEIDRLRGSGAAAGADAIVPAAREGDLPVTFAQERLWFVDALDPGSPVYAMPSSYLITGHLDHDALRRALAELVRRHEPLRTTLPTVDGLPVQRIAPPPADFDLPVADLRQLPERERRVEAGRLAAEAAQHRFDLARGPLFRVSLVHVDDAEHLVLLNLHHAIGDGWSMGVLQEELSALYGAFSRGEPSPLPEPALQYADYAVWQRDRLSGAALDEQLSYWRQALEGAPALLELPTDRPRPPVESHRGAVEGLVVAPGVTAEVNALARREGATLFMVLLAALDVVLGRLAGQEDIVVGTPIAGRTRAETDRMMGLFLNSLALRTDLSGDPSFRELLGRVRESTLSAYAHQDLPFERVLEEVRPERSLAHAPVFQVMLNLLNFEEGALEAEGLEVQGGGTGGELASKFDLTLYVGERDDRIVITLVYSADLFDAPRMRGLLAQLEGVLRQAAAAPETRVGALSLATEAARSVLPEPAVPLDDTWRGAVHEVFAARAAESPDALAVEDPRERWTYAELDAATDRIARALADAGVGTGDVVAITGHRSAALVRALVGTMKSGAAFLVLDPAYPAARLADYIRIARPAAHLHLSAAGDLPGEAAALLAETTRVRIVLQPRGDASVEDIDGLASVGDAPSVQVGPDTLAYLSFTSGTTGMPKAVMGRHSSLTHFTPWLAAEFGLEASDRFSLLSGLAHDPLHRDVFTPLQLGAAVIAPEPDETGTPGYLARWMREAGVTVAHLTPAMGQLLADAAEGERIDSLRRAFFVGDVLRRADVQRLASLAPNLRVINYYGSTETQRAVSYHVVDLAAEQKEIIPLGRGIPGVQLLVRNASGEVAGVGEVGEIWLRSPHLAAGYLGDAELSASRFVVNPWTGQATDRLYRTGDLGRYRPDGEVEPMGRADQQVKVRGFRVELGEVESALASHPAIKEAAVIARETAGGDRRLVAYWVPVEDSVEPDAASLRLHLKALLPEYMVPSAYVRLDRLPLTANAKLDRRALPEPEYAADADRYVAPRTPTEEILAQLWTEVLRTESVGVDDDFFALGGHSLLATRLLSRVQNTLGVVLPLRAVFEGPTIAELAARVEEIRRAGLPVLPPVAPVDRDRPLPLSFAQERLWFLDRLEGGSSAYNLPGTLRLSGALDVGVLERSLGEIVRRHESLRTVFRDVDGGAVQVIVPFAGFTLPIDDLSGLDETAREAEVRRRAREDAAHVFDLAEGPLFRATLLRVSEEEHVLLLCIHHIVSDGWSTGVLFRELNALSAAFARGEGNPLPPLPVQYADYAVWQREQLRGEVLDRQVGYWKERLAGAPALLELPTDRPRPPVQSHRGAREMFDLPRALLDGLQALGRSEGATLYMVMLGAFQVLLGKYAGSEDVAVGSPIAGRTRREVEELIGFFANTLVLRTDLSADPSFRELLRRVREVTLGAYEHQEVPFERLVAELQPERSLSYSPLFQVMFTLQNADRSGPGLPGSRTAGGVVAEVETTRFDLGLTAVPHDDGVYGVLEYSTDLFDRSTVQRMLSHLQRVLEQVAADADLRLSQLELLDPAERALVLDAWNATDAEFPADACIHALFEAQAERTPDAVAVVHDTESLTYAELNARANRLAHHLRERGVGPDARVAVCAGRGLEMVVGLLGVLKAGGAYVPLDPSYPADRLRYVLDDSAPVAVLTQRSLDGVEALLAGLAAPVIDLDGAEWANHPVTNPGRGALTPAHLAYVIYTSGSTGRPKGVAVPHRGVVNLLRSMRDTVGMEPEDRLLAITTYAFDISVLEIFLPLLHGARTIVLSRERAADPSALADAVRAYAPTVMQATPATWRMLVQSGWDGASELRALSGGEALPSDLASALRSRVGALWNVYGPTETTIWSTSEAVDGDAPGAVVPVGRPLANTRVYVLADGGEPVPVGVAGELYIGGAGVVRGYLGRPDQTAERFVADPFASEPGARLYRTGDLARWRPNGTLEFIGRTDFQVKVRGFRIELGEIEARLAEHADVREAVVMAREDVPGDVRLVAYVVGDADAESMRAHLSAALPEYMVPAAYVRLDALPLTPNGKLDRKALPAPEGTAYARRAFEAPLGEVEEALAEIWMELLGAQRVGRWDHFFELGGHSLLAVQVMSRVRQALGLEVALGELFTRPVLAEFARGLATAARSELPPIEPAAREGRVPLSFAQQRLWFLEQLGGLGGVYNISQRLPLRGELDRGALVRALDRIVARHEALRTTFAQIDGVSEQRIAAADSGFRLEEHDLSGQAAEVGRLLAEEARAPFDLERETPIRGRLIRVSPDEHVLAVTMHHIASDAWSMELFTRELVALYEAFRRGEPDPLPALPVQYADYAAWQRRWVEGDVLQSQMEYWTETLTGAPELLELPTDRPRPTRQDHAGAWMAVELDEALTAGLKSLGQRHGTTLFMTVLAGWAAVLGRLSGQPDVVVGTPTANRGRIEIEGLIGFFVNTLALRVDLDGSPSVAEVLARVKDRALGAQQNQDIPFEQVVELVQPVRSMAHSPLFQVMLGWQSASRGGVELPAIAPGSLASAGSGESAGSAGSVSDAAAKFDLSLDLMERDGRIVGGLTYATSLFDQATMERHVGYLRRALEAMVADDRQPVHGLALLPDHERRQVVETWNATDAEYPADACVHELFEAQAARTPDAVAVAYEDRSLTYAELNAHANRLAHHLRQRGVGPDVRVGICVERGLEMVAGLLGVLKAGGAYVPLDPGQPAERLAYMLADSAPAVVLTQQSLRDRVEAPDVPLIDLASAEWATCPETDPERAGLTSGRLAYVIYTSGSTGRPKGVAVPHRGVVNLLRSMRDTVGMEPADSVLAITTYAFDISVLEIFLPLLHGARTIVLSREQSADPSALAEAVRTHAPTVMQATPATWRMLVQSGWDGASQMRALSGGEALPADLASALGSKVEALWNVYGPTETTIWSTAEAVTGDAVGAVVPVGRPVANTRVYVLDEAGEPVPVGVAGELYIGGAGVVRGYLGRPDQTAERFVADAFGGEPGARLYRTGDLARWRADGTLEFLGRTDFQVKVRGFRIELGEIEARLAEHTAVREAVVMAREDVPGDVRLVAYVVGDADAESMRAHLSAALPEYMVPAAYVRLDALPLTPNGKLDRKALPAPDGGAYAARAFEAPLGEVEEALAEIWMELLGVERVGRWDQFFDLGGHSLLAVQVISRVRQVLGLEAEIRDLFARPVLAEFARGLATAAQSELPAIEPALREGRIPLSFAQQRLWFLEQLENLGGTYHVTQRLPLRGEVDRDALVRALDHIVARHETLRTTFAEVDGVPEQRIAPPDTGFRLGEHDLIGHPDARSELGRLLAEEAGTPFDLEGESLVRGRLIHVSPDEHVLAVTMHHIVSDAWSMELFTRELTALYEAFRRGEGAQLPPLPVQYADYAAWQRRWVEGDVLQSQVAYWTETLTGAPELLELPTDRPRPPRQDHAGAWMAVELDEALTAGLKSLGQRHGTTLFMTVLAGWAAVLGRLSGQPDVVVGTPTANRGRIEIEGLIGFFVNTLALRVELDGSPSVAEVLSRVKDRALGAQQNQDIPFEQVVELVQPVRSMAHSPLFQVMFGWQSASRGGVELPGIVPGSLAPGGSAGPAGAVSEAAAKFDLSLDLAERDGRIVGGLTYATSLFDQATMERHVGYLRRALEAMVADDRQPMHGLALLPDHERRQVVETWNATESEFPADACIHELFEVQAKQTPDAVAVVFEDRSLTYAELNAQANRLAHHLRKHGVGPDVRVGICVERGLEMVAGLLGVLKAGGAYVPLDPGQPAERLAYMLADAAPAVVLTQQALRDRVETPDVPVIDLEGAEWATCPETNPERSGLTPGHLAYVIYTSGSTGRPKGVAVPHRGVVNLLRSMRATVGMEPADSVLAITTYAFDISVLEIFLPLLHGARTIVLSRDRAADPSALADAVRAHVPTVMQATPATWRMLVQSGWEGAPQMRALSGGEALPADLASALRSKVEALWNVYGPTETTIWSTAEAVTGDSAGAVVSVGRPVANTRVYVLDEAGEPVPVGVAGELYIGGVGVVRGYLGRPDQTAERFVADAFGGELGARLYRTGDLARWRANGTLEFIGRTDFQVKVRGFRIELGEIEARLAEHRDVREAVVMAREDVPGDVRLVAYVVGDADAESLRAHLSAVLPEYMVPAAYVRLEALPLTPNGKLDRKALPAPEGDAYVSREYEAPVGKIEVALAEIWTELLRVERVGRNDHFFELGGHSLLALQVVSRVRQAMQVELELGAVFEKPVLSALAEWILEQRLARFDPEILARLAQQVREPGA